MLDIQLNKIVLSIKHEMKYIFAYRNVYYQQCSIENSLNNIFILIYN